MTTGSSRRTLGRRLGERFSLGFSSLRVTYMRPALGCLLDPVPGQ
jgi:hypothetical protein